MNDHPPNPHQPGPNQPGQPQWQQRPQWQAPVPPPQKKGKGRVIAAIVAGLLIVGGVLGVAALWTTMDDSYESPVATGRADSGAGSDTGERPDAPPASPPTSPPAPTPSSSPTTDPQQVREQNALYDADRMVGAGCRQQSSVALDSHATVSAYYRSVLPCLNRPWQRTLKGTGVEFQPARLKVFTGGIDTPCGGGLSYSFYCPSNHMIYMYADEIFNAWNQYAGDDFSHGITRLAAMHTIAHEYGHHVQSITGIFGSMGSDWPGTELERRSELQASCLGNVWMSAQRNAYPVPAQYWSAQWQPAWRFITRVPNHGSQANQQAWTDLGYGSARPSACNTWTVSSGRVL